MKTKIFRIGKRTISIVLSLMMMVSVMLVGMVTTVNAATETTVYFTPETKWPNDNHSNYTYRINVMLASNDQDNWATYPMTNTNETMNGKAVYSVTFTDRYDGAHAMQFQRLQNNQWNAESEAFNSTRVWTTPSTYNDKLWNGSSWVTYTPDSTTKTPDLYLFGDYGDGENWDNPSTSTRHFTETSSGYTLTFDMTGASGSNMGYFRIYDKANSEEYGPTNGSNIELASGEPTTLVKNWYESFSFDVGTTGKTVTINVNKNLNTITITAEQPSTDSNYIFFENTSNWSTVNAYIWKEEVSDNHAWPGLAMTKVAGNIYAIEVTNDAWDMVIFNNGSSTQTGNLNLQKGKLYTYNTGWGDLPTYTVKAQVSPSNSGTAVIKEYYPYESTTAVAVGTATASIPFGSKVVFEATAGSGYDFSSWTKSSGDSGTPSGATYTVNTLTQATTINANFTEKAGTDQNLIVVYDSTQGSPKVNNTSVTSGTPTTVTSNRTVTILANPVEGKAVDSVEFETASGNIPANYVLSGNTITFTMPDEAVTVNLSYRDILYYDVNVDYEDTKGSVTIDGASNTYTKTVKEGTSVTLVATAAAGFKFDGWEFSSEGYITSNALTDSTITFTPLTSISVSAKFIADPGIATDYKLIFNTSKDTLADNGKVVLSNTVYQLKNDDKYQVTFDAADVKAAGISLDNFTNTNYYVAMSTAGTRETMLFYGDKPSVEVLTPTTVQEASDSGSKVEDKSGYWVVLMKFIDAENIDQVTVTVDVSDKKYTISATSYITDDTVKVYAKNGTTRSGATCDYGETTVTGTTGREVPHGSYTTYYAAAGDKILVQTAMNDTYKSQGYYVYAYVINGRKYEATQITPGVYQVKEPITIDEDDLEITPVYYNSNIDTNKDYITIYVDPETLGDHWGNTISIYSYYYDAVDNKDTWHGDDLYPGQPMMLDSSGMYVAKVSRYAYVNGVKIADKMVSGITISNYYENESVHPTFLGEDANGHNQKRNLQSYDYDDFKYIAALGYDTVKFDIKYFNNTTTNQKKLLNNANNAPNKTGSTITISEYDSINGWQQLQDFDDNPVSIIGYTDKSVPSNVGKLNSDAPLHIVSVGNQKTSMGKWSTIWYVYDSEGKYVTQGLPSDFISRVDGTGEPLADNDEGQTQAYRDIVSKGYEYNTAYITYESEQGPSTSCDSANSGTRLDGRWYYARSTVQVTAKVGIVYKVSAESTTWIRDTYAEGSTTGTVTGATALVDGKHETTVDRNTVLPITATNGHGYIFTGWAKVGKDAYGNATYTDLGVSAMSSTITVGENIEIVAMYEPAESGTLYLSHTMYKGEGANGGTGYFNISASIVDSNGNAVPNTDSFTDNDQNGQLTVNSEMANNEYQIKITLKTTPFGLNTFNCFYIPQDNISAELVKNSGTVTDGVGTYEITIPVRDLFSKNESTGNYENQVIKTINYYSDILAASANYTIVYKYKNRFGEDRSYTHKDVLTEQYLGEHGYTLDCEDGYSYIQNNAPEIDDLHKNCVWYIEDENYTTIEGVKAVVVADQPIKTYDVTIKLNGEEFTSKNNLLNSYLYQKNTTEYYRCDDANFKYWSVFRMEDGQNTEKEVARCYSRDYTLKIVDDYYVVPVTDQNAENIASIGDATYTREKYNVVDEKGNIIGQYDYLYADFIVAYMDKEYVELSKDHNYKTGVIIEMSQGSVLNPNESTDYTQITFDSDLEQIKAAAIAQDVLLSKYTYNDTDKRKVYNFTIDNDGSDGYSGYNNFNRLDYFVKFENNETNRNLVMKAYYYVYKVDNSGNIVTDDNGKYIILTDCVYFNLYEIGTSNADVQNKPATA